MKPDLRILCFQSLTACGDVGLKAYAHSLHPWWIPVPSILLNGPGNMPGCRRTIHDGLSMLTAAIEAPMLEEKSVVLAIGYLTDVAQLEGLCTWIEQHRNRFQAICIDPICGDHGKAYVSEMLIHAYPQLLKLGTYHFPNRTELQLITGFSDLEYSLDTWKRRFPESHLFVTGVEEGNKIGVLYQHGAQRFQLMHARLSGNRSGAGDLFLGAWIRNHLIFGRDLKTSVRTASQFAKKMIS